MLHAIQDLTAANQSLLDSRFAERLLTLDDGVQAVREVGNGPAIVLLHGIGSGAASWLQVALQLSERARVIAWDAPGYGASTPLTQSAPVAGDYAERLLMTLDALGIERCVLVGHSLGALTAAAFASGLGRERVSRLVLLSPARGYGDPAREIQRQQVRSKRLQALEQLGIEQMAEQRSAHMLSPKASNTALAWVRWNMARLNVEGYRQAIELLCGDDLLRYAPLPVPCEVHCGEADSITVPTACLSLAKALDAPFSLIPDAGHASPIEQPHVVTGRLAYALKQSLTGSAL
ncbi:alpha/beta fold hydrolase [Pseudomonas sp. R5(2019)]|uniref:alpha/beta fold hydrolase n=1 Tax=Pseudomonas sp. R5(2019) TaxID=2697566 RepID=UPI0014128199|nr:alpha/beta fold hydrolase [Pseudomonas sp. R5(2019)]NBA94466.1 alpha/beta fold hydrolase [Pseudomonas sp. R5(2019)]